MSKHRSLRVDLGVLAVAALVFAGSVLTGAADILHFDPSYGSLSAPAHGASQCWQGSAGVKDWTGACRTGTYRQADAADPFHPPAPVRYDYPSYGPGVAGSSLSFVFGRNGQEHFRPPAHAD